MLRARRDLLRQKMGRRRLPKTVRQLQHTTQRQHRRRHIQRKPRNAPRKRQARSRTQIRKPALRKQGHNLVSNAPRKRVNPARRGLNNVRRKPARNPVSNDLCKRANLASNDLRKRANLASNAPRKQANPGKLAPRKQVHLGKRDLRKRVNPVSSVPRKQARNLRKRRKNRIKINAYCKDSPRWLNLKNRKSNRIGSRAFFS
jgi:hypothetical protein